MDLNDIALFVHVVRAGSFAEAGRRLGIPPSTGSRRLQALERSVGVRLLQRSTRRLALTDAGQAFFAQCAEQIDALNQSAQDLADSTKQPSGRVRVAAGVDFLNWFPMESIADFMARHPAVRVEFVLSDARADLLADGIDVAVRSGKMVEPMLVAREIGWIEWRMVASPDYLSTHGTPNSPQDLTRHECITLPSMGSTPAIWRLRGPDGTVEVPVNSRFQVNTQQAQLGAALANLGIALVPSLTTLTYLKRGVLQEVLPGYSHAAGVYFVFPSRRHIPRAVRAFTEYASTVLFERGMVIPSRHQRSQSS
ncbi:LysR family transcriptional regulator [Pseudomonas umsongensis]|nr:LysR family transcriptional regulator [Pseudomonas umsongensis]